MTLTMKYRELCDKTDKLLEKYNPCRWDAKAKQCARGTHGCCHGCPTLGKKGCTVKSLACKLWICPEVRLRMPEHILDEFRHVWNEAQGLNLLTFRGSEEESVKNARYASRTSCPRYVCVSKYGETDWILEK